MNKKNEEFEYTPKNGQVKLIIYREKTTGLKKALFYLTDAFDPSKWREEVKAVVADALKGRRVVPSITCSMPLEGKWHYSITFDLHDRLSDEDNRIIYSQIADRLAKR